MILLVYNSNDADDENYDDDDDHTINNKLLYSPFLDVVRGLCVSVTQRAIPTEASASVMDIQAGLVNE